jgi:hypothetical protein
MIRLVWFARCLSFYPPFRCSLFLPMVFFLLFPIVFIDLCVIKLFRFVNFFLQPAAFFAELNIKILLLHIRVLLLDLLDSVQDLRLENLFLNGADHLDPSVETV